MSTSKPLFLICSDMSAEMVSNGKNALLRLATELVRQGVEVQILFTINQHPYIVNGVCNFYNKTFDEFKTLHPNETLGVLYRRFQRINYTRSQLAIYGLKCVDNLEAIKKRDYVVIYPETFSKNPLNAENVIRYYGFKPDILNDHESIPGQYGRDEFKLAASRNLLSSPDFTLFDPHIDELFIRKNMTNWDDRELSLVYKGKSKAISSLNLGESFIEINRQWPDRFTFSKLLHKSKYLFTYDSYSILNIEAILAGAVPIFCDNWHMTDEELDSGELGVIPRFTVHDFAIKNIDIEHFENERRRLINILISLQENWPNEVSKFVKKVLDRFPTLT